jgi:Ca2+:H+ antiporter
VLVLLSYVVGRAPMNLQFWPGAVTMVMISAVMAAFITNSGRLAWFIGALLLFVYAIFAMTLYVVPPAALRIASVPASRSAYHRRCGSHLRQISQRK